MIIIMISLFAIKIFAKEWNGIVPCKSTRSDVEKILGKDSFYVPDVFGNYKFGKDRVSVLYDRKDKNNPDQNIVKMIHVFPEETIILKEYIKKIPDFHKNFTKRELDIKETHIYGEAIYYNVEEGFEIRVQKDPETDEEVVSFFRYFHFASGTFCPNLKSGSPKH